MVHFSQKTVNKEKSFSSSRRRNSSFVPLEDINSPPPYHPAIYETLSISSDPEKVQSHFIRLRSANRKGQGRCRCVTCGHEFECTGKLRLAQHVLGSTYSGNQSKNVKTCPSPFMPLKLSLAAQYLLKTDEHGNVVKLAKLQSLEVLECRDDSLSGYKPPDLLSLENASFDQEEDDDDFLNILSSFESPIEEEGDNEASLEQEHLQKRIKLDQTNASSVLLAEPPSADFDIVVANNVIMRFLQAYQLPIATIEDPIFLKLLEAIRLAGPAYRPDLSCFDRRSASNDN